MDLFSKDELESLLIKSDGRSVSIYMPTERAGRETEQNPIRFKNLLKKAEAKLEQRGIRSPEVKELLKPAYGILDDYPFWQHQSDGLALFLSPDIFTHFRLPYQFPQLAVVTDRFHIKPLLPMLGEDGRFYLLALSQNNTRLFEGTRSGLIEVEPDDMPDSLADALWFEVPQKQLQFYTGMPAAKPGQGGKRQAAFHGTGAGDEDIKKAVLRYFQRISSSLNDFLEDQQAPLVLAGVNYLFPIYKQASKYNTLMEEGISGNPDDLSIGELHQKAWDIVEPYFTRGRENASERYKEYSGAGSDLVTNELEKIVSASYFGRVDSLFVAVGVQKWGTFNHEKNEVEVQEEPVAGSEDLLDFSAIHTLLNGGSVYAVEPEEIPDDSFQAAIFRY